MNLSAQSPMNGAYDIASGVAPPYRGEYFEIYSPVLTSRYADVNWKMQAMPLPPAIVSRFAGRAMAVTGYEVDVVRRVANGTDERVPCYEQYNHHYTGFMSGSAGYLHTPVGDEEGADDVSMHGLPMPRWMPSAVCDLSGTWLNDAINVSVKVIKAGVADDGAFNASCLDGKGWPFGSISVFPNDTASLIVPHYGDAAGTLNASTSGAPRCSLLTWLDAGNVSPSDPGAGRNVWCKQPYCAKGPAPPLPGGNPHANPHGIPHTQAFSEGNGNEHRRSYHGYAVGFAQLIHSPTVFRNSPMMINTNKRLVPRSVDPSPGHISNLLPKSSLAPPNATYAGIMECPCTDRKPKVIGAYKTAAAGTCASSSTAASATECTAAAKALGVGAALVAQSVESGSLPPGCSVAAQPSGALALTFNTERTSMVACGMPPAAGAVGERVVLGGGASALLSLGLKLDAKAGVATITLVASGANAAEWFGVGFNATSMASLPYAIIVDGVAAGSTAPPTVHERVLGNHDPGSDLGPSAIKVVSHSVNAKGVRTVVLERPLAGATAQHFTFDATLAQSLPFITAVGSAPKLAYHRARAAALATLTVQGGTGVCLCRDPTSNTGTIGGLTFNSKVCAAYPLSELLSKKNDICNISTYGGGLYCCHDGTVLLENAQVQPTAVDEFQLKYRFYFNDYTNQSNLFRVWWSTEATNNEYDVPKSRANCLDAATPAENCTYTIKSQFQARQMIASSAGCMVSGDAAACGDVDLIEKRDGGFFRLMYAAAHCHAPACMSIELWNDDTGELICRNVPIYGNSTEAHNEESYLVGIPPCLWGSEAEGLLPPPRLHLDANLTSIKRVNNTNGHWGVMALWQMRAAYDGQSKLPLVVM